MDQFAAAFVSFTTESMSAIQDRYKKLATLLLSDQTDQQIIASIKKQFLQFQVDKTDIAFPIDPKVLEQTSSVEEKTFMLDIMTNALKRQSEALQPFNSIRKILVSEDTDTVKIQQITNIVM